eukprot:1755623-Rhodomonas_salina.2
MMMITPCDDDDDDDDVLYHDTPLAIIMSAESGAAMIRSVTESLAHNVLGSASLCQSVRVAARLS